MTNDMNENAQKVHAFLLGNPYSPNGDWAGFAMEMIDRCIAGATVFVLMPERWEEYDDLFRMKDSSRVRHFNLPGLLGISDEVGDRLFALNRTLAGPYANQIWFASAEQAARALELACGGDSDPWGTIFGAHSP
jgi:hypothetical protein